MPNNVDDQCQIILKMTGFSMRGEQANLLDGNMLYRLIKQIRSRPPGPSNWFEK
jgi:hypothetical protein